MHTNITIAVACILSLTPALPAAESTLWYGKPAGKWEEANPIANGRLGAMIFGGVTNEHLQLNENTLYSGWPGYRDVPLKIERDFAAITNHIAQRQFTEADGMVTEKWLGGAQACYQPLGDLFLEVRHSEKATNYKRELDLAAATWRLTYEVDGVKFAREVFASHPEQCIAIRLTASKPASLNFRVRLASPHSNAVVKATPDKPLLAMDGQVPGFVLRRDLALVERKKETWKYPAIWDAQGNRKPHASTVLYGKDINGEGMFFGARLEVLASGGKVTPEGDALSVAGADEATILFTAASSFNGFDKNPVRQGVDARAKADRALQAAKKLTFAELKQRHIQDYRALFDRVSLDLGPAQNADLPTDERIKRSASNPDPGLAALYFQFGRYLMISGSRPGGQPLNLQGLWNSQIIPPWASAYTVNINTEMNYWPAEMLNLSECHEPMLRMVRELAIDGRRVAREVYGRRGWVAHHNTTIWRDAQPVDGAAVAAFWPMASGWFCQHLWEHYQFTGDRAFLAESYPVMKAACEFYLDWLVDNGKGQLVTPVSTSPENNFSYLDQNGKKTRASVSSGCTMDMAIIRDLFGNTVRAGELLGLDPEFRALLATTTAKLLPYQVGANGRLQEWQEDFADADPAHRHVSHLFALHPGAQITVRGTPALAAAAKRTLGLRGDGGTGWSKAWKVNFWARLEDGDHAHKMLNELLSKSTMPNMLDTHPPFQIDGNFGGISGMTEMLLQSHAGELHLLPALPTAWPNGTVRGLCARGAFQLDITWAGGKLVKADLRSLHGNPCTLRSGDKVASINTQPGKTYSLDSDLHVVADR